MSLPIDRAVDAFGRLTSSWVKWANDVDKLAAAQKLSGPTANRPTDFLFVGRQYFDTTLGKPIWLKAVGPVVWVDATGATV